MTREKANINEETTVYVVERIMTYTPRQGNPKTTTSVLDICSTEEEAKRSVSRHRDADSCSVDHGAYVVSEGPPGYIPLSSDYRIIKKKEI